MRRGCTEAVHPAWVAEPLEERTHAAHCMQLPIKLHKTDPRMCVVAHDKGSICSCTASKNRTLVTLLRSWGKQRTKVQKMHKKRLIPAMQSGGHGRCEVIASKKVAGSPLLGSTVSQ
eukprot:scaffold95309_cov15-Tisochrysis_lutea.AAC.2